MSKDYVLYWTSLETFENCPRKFLWDRGWGNINFGRGPGKGKRAKKPKSRHNAVMGIVIGSAIEDLYNQELWRNSGTVLKDVQDRVRRKFQIEIRKPWNKIDYNLPYVPSQTDLLKTCLEGAAGYLKTMRAQKLLGPFARSEYHMLGFIDKYNKIGGKADIIFRRDRNSDHLPGLSIIDAKNSKTKGKYTNPDQLRWYALCFYLSSGKLPDRLGFAYLRYPYGAPQRDEKGMETGEIEQGVDWVPFDKESIVSLAKRAKEARKQMNKRSSEADFEPVPKPPVCRFCDFEDECPERIAQREANAAKRKPRAGKPPVIADESVFGFVDVSLSDDSG